MFSFSDKLKVFSLVQERLNEKLNAAVEETTNAKNAANHEESKAENKYDTRGLEASYMAQALGKRVVDIKENLYNLTQVDLKNKNLKVGVGTLVKIFYVDRETEAWFFILPTGGLSVSYKNVTIKTLTALSPLGKSLLNKEAEDEFTFNKGLIEVLETY